MAEVQTSQVCARIAQVRNELDGPRGKASFAKRLGLSPSTYDYYESSRIPPASTLVKIAEVAAVDLYWLLTGQTACPSVRPEHPAIRRAAELLGAHEDASAPLAAFLDLLTRSMAFPPKAQDFENAGLEAVSQPPAAPAKSAQASKQPPTPVSRPATAPKPQSSETAECYIPVLGRSAAGVPQFWADENESQGVTTLMDLLSRRRGEEGACVSEAQMQVADNTGVVSQQDPVQIISIARRDGEAAEFVNAASLGQRYGECFALRIDGESMSPEIRHGDLVVLSPAQQAVDGRAAVVQLRRQIGVTCKILRRQGQAVHLIPVNEQYAPQAFDSSEVVWSLRVLARIRPHVAAPAK